VERIADDLYQMLLVEEGINFKTPIIQYILDLKK